MVDEALINSITAICNSKGTLYKVKYTHHKWVNDVYIKLLLRVEIERGIRLPKNVYVRITKVRWFRVPAGAGPKILLLRGS